MRDRPQKGRPTSNRLTIGTRERAICSQIQSRELDICKSRARVLDSGAFDRIPLTPPFDAGGTVQAPTASLRTLSVPGESCASAER